MSRLFIWVCLIVGMGCYRLIVNTTTPIEEHIAGIYFAGVALGSHWLSSLAKKGEAS
jgi:hypothetical protein